jgi:hypothetical protein
MVGARLVIRLHLARWPFPRRTSRTVIPATHFTHRHSRAAPHAPSFLQRTSRIVIPATHLTHRHFCNAPRASSFPQRTSHIVIPAKAGIHFQLSAQTPGAGMNETIR